MDSSLPLFFSLPFVDSVIPDLELKSEAPVYDVLSTSISSHNALLGTDDVLAQFLSGDEPLEEPDLNGPTILHCEICRKQFDNAKKYYGHLRVHSKDNLWICDKCPNQKFSTKQQLMKHSLTHKPLELIWKCPYCTMAFETLFKLQQHLLHKYLDYRPHKCDECEKTFYKPSDLKKHKDTHSEYKKFKCSMCEMRFKDKSNMKRHMLRHTNEKPFCCPGCRNRFKQLASMKRHAQKCPLNRFESGPLDKSVRRHHCRLCGLSFQYKSLLLEHGMRQHTSNLDPTKEDKYQNSDANRIVDNIVDDILSAEDDYMTMSTQNPILNVYNQTNIDNTADNLMQIELLKDINQLQILDDELLYNDLDFASIQPSQIFNTNTNDIDYSQDKNGEILFDFTDGKSIDQDIMNAICHNKELPDEFLQSDALASKVQTIFESDVDLEASTNLAANLNQLIGDNHVQYISTEHDDTFIISLKNEIDAQKLTDMLNIGVELVNNKNQDDNTDWSLAWYNRQDDNTVLEDVSTTAKTTDPVHVEIEKIVEPIVVKVDDSVISNAKQKGEKTPDLDSPSVIEEISKDTKEVKPKVNKTIKLKIKIFVCRTCNKVFYKKDNYKSHRALHEPSLRSHACNVCGERFGYRSSLNKHVRAKHTPVVLRPHVCHICQATYSAAWMLKTHISRDHEGLTPHACDYENCGKKFFKRSDLVLHKRHHTGEKPYSCEICKRAFLHVSHLRRHTKAASCNKQAGKKALLASANHVKKNETVTVKRGEKGQN